jgi:hypothetical protein
LLREHGGLLVDLPMLYTDLGQLPATIPDDSLGLNRNTTRSRSTVMTRFSEDVLQLLASIEELGECLNRREMLPLGQRERWYAKLVLA